MSQIRTLIVDGEAAAVKPILTCLGLEGWLYGEIRSAGW
jgi:hypothetical protein